MGWRKAASSVSRTHPEVHFVLAGPGVDTGNAELVRRAAAIGEQRVHLLGARSDMPRLLAGIDMIVDGTDNFETRFALNQVAHATGRAQGLCVSGFTVTERQRPFIE